MGPTSTARSDLDARFAAFTTTVESLPDAAWDQPSPCADWRARDVVAHVIDTQRDFCSRHGIELTDLPGVDTDPNIRWATHTQAMASALIPELFDRPFDGHFGPSTIGAALLDVYGFDLIVHRWDLAQAAGSDSRFTETEMDALDASIAQFGDAMYAAGICSPALDVPADADRQTALLASMGRAVGARP